MSKLAKEYFEINNINRLSWLSQSPDMNQIDNLWVDLKKKVRSRSPKKFK